MWFRNWFLPAIKFRINGEPAPSLTYAVIYIPEIGKTQSS